MRRDLHALATRYIDEVIRDQQKLGHTKAVAARTRKAAVADAEVALRELARSSKSTKALSA
jgi:hypothetical protein